MTSHSRRESLALAALAAAMLLAVAVASMGNPEVTNEAPATTARAAETPAQTPATAGHEGHNGHGGPSKKSAATVDRVHGKTLTIVGEVMDPACYLEAGVKSIGPGHFQCAIDCAKSGQTLAIYDRAEDRIYFVAGELPGKNPNAPLLPYIHKKVDVTGTVYHRSGAYGIVILNVALHEEKTTTPSTPAKSEPTGK